MFTSSFLTTSDKYAPKLLSSWHIEWTKRFQLLPKYKLVISFVLHNLTSCSLCRYTSQHKRKLGQKSVWEAVNWRFTFNMNFKSYYFDTSGFLAEWHTALSLGNPSGGYGDMPSRVYSPSTQTCGPSSPVPTTFSLLMY